ncbi:hypothetical protein AB0K16_44080 [Nonomuraea jabiensis]|uniref:hypothetical protein n=1 Tax=Nonomuraea jabiensis TaxID=882448 RepID=UPI00341C9AA6
MTKQDTQGRMDWDISMESAAVRANQYAAGTLRTPPPPPPPPPALAEVVRPGSA